MRAIRARAVTGAFLCAVFFLLAGARTTDAPAAHSIRPMPGAPDPRLMVLTSADLRGARVARQAYYKDGEFPSAISYGREFEDGGSGSVPLPYVDSEAAVGTSARSTTQYVAQLRRLLASKGGRKLIIDSFEEEFPTGSIVSNAQVGRPRNLGVGAGSFDLLITVRILGLRTDLHISIFRVERALGGLVTVGTPGRRVPLSVMTRLAKVMAARMIVQLAPRSTAPPTVTGTAAVGQTLTATTGTWAGAPTTFAAQWERCDSAGASCVAISGATNPTYVVTDADVGSALRVSVTARNAVGTATAASAPTAAVQATGPPTNTALPTITGTAQVGQTLTATTGAWNGSPTGFAFQWQRCSATGTSCVDLPGATGGTYVVTAGDAGSTIRVVVTATNSIGSASAASAPAPVVS